MECNRDEAIKAKELAEKKLSNKDLIGARKFALKAQALFPDLDGIHQLLSTLDVYISAEKKLNGEMDWYGVLGVDPSADEDTLRKQYRKLALILHPDKNKSFGADGAFKILSEAWSLMSDKSKRALYDERRNNTGLDPKPSFNGNGFHQPSSKGNSSTKIQKNTKNSHSNVHLPFQSRSNTFWTACNHCRMQYEYLNVYLDQRLLCPNCQEPFYAKRMPPPQVGPYAQQQTTSNHSFMPGPAQGGQPAYKRTASDINGSTFPPKNDRPQKRGRPAEPKPNDSFKVIPQTHKIREPSFSETRNMLMNRATKSISHYLTQLKNSSLNTTLPTFELNNTMTVPDPDFHNFDNDRTEDSFSDNQVWAAYDDDDGMPRYYAMIHTVVSRTPFKMRISWLNSKSNAELGSMSWIASGFYKTCGEFRVGKHELNTSINSFSHKVSWAKGARGAIQIYPRRGDVWALYRNWSSEWDENTPDEVIHKYKMVEVMEDYDEERGLVVVPLVKVKGYKTVFRQSLDATDEVVRIPKEEMFRLSHQVPSCLLSCSENPDAPVGCMELDPAATPLELLGVVTD